MTLSELVLRLVEEIVDNPDLLDRQVYLDTDSLYFHPDFEFVRVHRDGEILFGRD